MESLKDPTAHAEIIAITSASNTIGDWRLNKCSLYVTKEPCLMCIGAILNSRIENLYYGMPDKENGYITTNKFINSSVHLKSIEGSILEFDSKKIIQDFFLNKR
jgi:tRNA(adenine34) deaminase